MAKKQTNLAPAVVVTPEPEPPIVQPIEQPPAPVEAPIETPPARTVVVVQLRAGYSQCRSAGVVFGPDPIEFALDDYRLPEFRACKYLTVN